MESFGVTPITGLGFRAQKVKKSKNFIFIYFICGFRLKIAQMLWRMIENLTRSSFGVIWIIILGLIWGPKSEKIEKNHYFLYYILKIAWELWRMIKNIILVNFGVILIIIFGLIWGPKLEKVGFCVFFL